MNHVFGTKEREFQNKKSIHNSNSYFYSYQSKVQIRGGDYSNHSHQSWKLILSQLYTFCKKFNTTFLFAPFRYAFVHKKTWLGWFLSNGFFILAMFVLCLTFIVVSLLFCCHSYLMLTAQTTWEYMSRSRISYLKTLSEGVNPFDQGVFCNVYSFLCRCRVQKWEVLLRQRDRWA